MKFNHFFGLAVAALMLFGCTRDLTEVTPTTSDNVVRGPLVKKALIFEESRLSLGEAGEFEWSQGDKVAVVLNNSGSYQLDPEAYTVNHLDATIEVPSNAAYLIYPYSIKGDLNGANLTLKLPQSYDVENPEDVLQFNPMRGIVTEHYIAFKNLLGYAKVPLTGSGLLKSVTLKPDNSHGIVGLSETCTLDITKDVTEGGLVPATTVDARSFVKVNYPYTLDLSASPVVYIPVPAGDYSNVAVIVETATDGAFSIYGSATHTIARSTEKAICSTINVNEHKAAAPTSLSGNSGTSYNDYANTYIVPPIAGEYSFKAVLTDGTELAGGVTAEILWTEEVGLVYDLHYNPSTNEISFKTNGNKGNALVTLSKNNFGGKTIVWSWLLWCTDQPKDILVPGGGTSAGHRYVVLDRVIGATWAPSSELDDQRSTLGTSEKFPMNASISATDATNACGTYYQYQNMIPYPRIINIDAAAGGKGKETTANRFNTRIAALYGFHQYAQYWSTSTVASTISVDENNQYRTAASYQPHYEYSVGNNSWCFSLLYSSNGGVSGVTNLEVETANGKAYRLWRSSTSQTTQMQLKTNHDPCPAGYALDNSSATYHYVSTRAAGFGYVRNPQDDSSYNQGYKLYGMYLNGCWYGEENDANKTVLYFPCGGNRTSTLCGTADSYGNMGYIYLVNTSNANTFSYTSNEVTYTQYNGACLQYGATADSGKTLGNAGYSSAKSVNAQGYNIRCRKAGH